MVLADLTSREAVLQAIGEYDRIGEKAFLRKYGFGRARDYFLLHEGRRYHSKAIVGAAYGFQHPQLGPLTPDDFSGGEKRVQPKLEGLGFVVETPGPRTGSEDKGRNADWTRDELILALDLYFRLGRKVPSATNSDVIALSELLNSLPIHSDRGSTFRNPNGVNMKLANFRSVDPTADGGRGLARGNRLESVIWAEYSPSPERLRAVASAIAANARAAEAGGGDVSDDEEFEEGTVLYRVHRRRERSGEAVRRKKASAGGRLSCEICTFDF